MEPVRNLAFEFFNTGEEDAVSKAEALGEEDRALFQELTVGAAREWRFLEWVVAKFAKKPPRAKPRLVLQLAAYQLLFLDRIPDYAIFSETKKMGSRIGLSEPESKFLHGVLKSIQREKTALMAARNEALEVMTHGERLPQTALEWAVLNATPELLEALSGKVQSLAAMRRRAELVGYALPSRETPKAQMQSIESGLAPRAVRLTSGENLSEDLKQGRVRIQGEASQWACEVAAEWLGARAKEVKGRPLRILELATGKGGKFLGTLAAWTERLGGEVRALPEIEWTAVDPALGQRVVFERDTRSLAHKIWPQARVDLRAEASESGEFDFVWLDAPCSGLGTLAKLPQIALKWKGLGSPEFRKIVELQKRLCDLGLSKVISSGAFFYTVCTLTEAETVENARYVEKQSGLKLIKEQVLWPGQAPAPRAEGFYALLMVDVRR